MTLLSSGNVFAVGVDAKPEELLSLSVSSKGPTRLVLKDEKIADVFFTPENAAKVVLHDSTGEAFILSSPEGRHIYVTIMGEKGSKQDLKLSFTNKEPSPIFIEQKAHAKNLMAAKNEIASPAITTDHNSDFAQECLQSKEPKKRRYLFSRTKNKKEVNQHKKEANV